MTLLLLALLLLFPRPASALSLTVHATFPGGSVVQNPCDPINCEGEIDFFQHTSLAAFAIPGAALYAIDLTYDLLTVNTLTATDPNVESDFGAHAFTQLGIQSFLALADTGPVVTPGATAHLVGTRHVLPGDPLFAAFLGPGDVPVLAHSFATEHSDVFLAGCRASGRSLCDADPTVSPILLSSTFSGSVDATYIYGAPAASVPNPGSGLLIAVSLVMVLGGALVIGRSESRDTAATRRAR